MSKKNNESLFLIEPQYFLTMIAGNVNNKNLSDADFRALLKNNLPIVNWPGRESYAKEFENTDDGTTYKPGFFDKNGYKG